MKAVIFDASTLISLSMNGLTDKLKDLKNIFKGNFLITKDVYREVIEKPIKNKRFELEAIRIKQLVDEKVLELPGAVGVQDSEIDSKTTELTNLANETFQGREKNIHVVDKGEISCMALSRILDEKKIQNVIAVDERTLRLLSEKPENIKKRFEKKLHTSIAVKKENFKAFSGFRFIRSAELMYVAWKKGLVKMKHPKILDALLWALKFKGCSISEQEIKEIEGMR